MNESDKQMVALRPARYGVGKVKFTGYVSYAGSEFYCRDARFDLRVKKPGRVPWILWYSGVFVDGSVNEHFHWNDGVWLNGIFDGGVWENGEWMDGTWKSGLWKNGTWHRGKYFGVMGVCARA